MVNYELSRPAELKDGPAGERVPRGTFAGTDTALWKAAPGCAKRL